jgi:ketosteroid isomerase-like protein
MTHRAACLAFVVIVLSGCASQHTDQAKADEAAVRRTIADLEQRINRGDIGFVNVFANDAIIIAPSAPDIVGFDAIRKLYTDMMKGAAMTVHFSTEEVAVAGDMAWERGSYTLRIADKTTGRVLQDVKNKHVHIFKRQPDGTWKTWRMMVNSAELAPAQK